MCVCVNGELLRNVRIANISSTRWRYTSGSLSDVLVLIVVRARTRVENILSASAALINRLEYCRVKPLS